MTKEIVMAILKSLRSRGLLTTAEVERISKKMSL